MKQLLVSLQCERMLQELNESRMRTTVEVEEVDSRLQVDYEARLAEALQQMREENDAQIRATRGEAETYFQRKVGSSAPSPQSRLCIGYMFCRHTCFDGHVGGLRSTRNTSFKSIILKPFLHLCTTDISNRSQWVLPIQKTGG